MATIMAASIAGFLPYNTRKTAHVFSGDVGALTVGFGFAACSLLLVSETDGNGLLYVGPVLILPFLTDILMTMLVRARRKENLLAAHSSHIYQRLIRAGYSHVNVAIYYTTAAITAGLTAMIGLHSGLIRSVYFLALLTCLWVAIYLLIHRKYPSAGGQPRMQPDP
jgi:UDP-N-acetylmuramyl pentapeptide phosphotransferase/UDP-N-acetylglucosamine-1-phosphate transferase